MFLDICGFTARSTSADMTAGSLVAFLHHFFGEVDALSAKYGVQKVKLLGDGGMYVCGAPEPVENHATNMFLFALDILQLVGDMSFCGEPFNVRIGLASGSIISGVIGDQSFSWDIWGTVVNLASRLESVAETGSVNASLMTYHLLQASQNSAITTLIPHMLSRDNLKLKGFPDTITSYTFKMRDTAIENTVRTALAQV
jgi:class 3 adenylate cyclase